MELKVQNEVKSHDFHFTLYKKPIEIRYLGLYIFSLPSRERQSRFQARGPQWLRYIKAKALLRRAFQVSRWGAIERIIATKHLMTTLREADVAGAKDEVIRILM